MKTFAIQVALAVIFSAGLVAPACVAQTSSNSEQGVKPNDASVGGDIDSVSLSSGSLLVRVPITSLSQRGDLGLSFTFRHASKQWMVVSTSTSSSWQPGGVPQGIVSNYDYLLQRILNVSGPSVTEGVYSPDGALHPIYAGSAISFPARTTDATGIVMLDPDTIATPNGTRISGFANGAGSPRSGRQPTVVTDRNGNQITVSSTGWTDTLGRFIPGSRGSFGYFEIGVPTTDLTNCPTGTASARVFDLPGFAGTNREFKLCYANIILSTAFGVGSTKEYGPVATPLLSAIVRPDLTSWTFSYDNYGDITRIGYPTGGSVSYTYVTSGLGNPCSDSTSTSRWIATRTVDATDGAGGHQWKLNWNGTAQTVTVTDPLGNDVVHKIAEPVANACTLYDVQQKYFQRSSSSGTLLRTIDELYSGAVTPFDEPIPNAVNVVLKQQTITLPGGQVTKTAYQYDNGVTEPSTTLPIVLGSLLQRDGYDFAGNVVRSTINHYKWQDDPNYLSGNLLKLPTSALVQDGQARMASRVTYGYDESPFASSGITVGHGAAPGPVRGNATRTSTWLDTKNADTSATVTYFDTGMPATYSDALGHTTSFAYASTYFGAYVTQATAPTTQMPDQGAPVVSHVAHTTYDFNTGVVSQTIDQNGNPANSTVDNMLRPSTQTLADGAQVTFRYPDAYTSEMIRVVNQTTGATDDNTEKVDGLGRVIHQTHLTGGGRVQVDTTYDAIGRVASRSNPCYAGASDATCGVTQTAYDALGRVVKVTRPDGSFAGSAYQDNCTTGTDEVGRQRRVCSDALGQTIEVDEQSAGSPSLPAQGVLTISGALVTANIAAKGSFTITGTEQSAVSATPGSGTVTVGGNEVSKSLLSHSATPATGSVTINGTEGSTTIDPCADQGFGKSCPKTVYDVGKVTVTINGVPATVSYGQGSSGTTITSALVTAFGTNSTFVVSSSGNVLNVKAQTAGTAGNAITLSSSTQGSDFSGSVSGPTLANGTDDAYTLVYDTGNVGASVNGLSKSVTYDQNSNGTTIASALASAFNADSTSSVTASASTNIVTFTTKATGTGTNYPLSATSSMTSTNFSTPSFTPTTSGTTLTAGQNATTFDAGSVSVTVNGTSYNTSYSSSTDNAGSLAASLASQINASSTRVVDASASGGTMSLTAHTAGSAGNAITIAASWQHTSSTTFPNSSFTDSASGTNLTGGADSSTDSGTLTATVGSLTTASVPYGTANNATSAQVASALAKVLGVSGSPVVVNGVSGSTIGLVYKTVGTAGNGLAVVVTPTSSQPAIYPNGTFGSLTSLSGGATATSGSLSTPYVTKYVYDTLGRMRCLEQHGDAATGTGCSADPTLDASSPWRIRRFDYDSLSRRTSETTPESGKTCYGTYDANHQCVPAYDDDSRLLTKTDARGVVTQFTYDDLNRLLGATYSDGSLANSFRYDYSTFNGITIENPIGRAVAATTANGMIAQMTSYDVIGRVKAVYQCTPAFSTCQASTATYDAIGDPLTVTYPNGFTMRYTYDIAGRVLAASDSNGNNYAQGAVYAPFGGQQQLTMPNFFFSNVFNNRLQEASSYAGNGGALVLFNKQYNFDATGHNAGDLLSIVNLKDQSRNQSFSYDGLDRLIQASEGSRWSNVYVIDAWNNLRQKVGMTSTSENIAATVDVRNRLTSYQANGATMNFVYDEDGDVRSDGRLGYSYDAANWLRAAGATTYSYDANGRRVSKTGGPNYWYGPSGQLLAESDAAGNWTNFVYFGERRLARKDTNGAVRYFVNDYSLTTNVFADANGTILEERDVFPWGATVTGVGQSGSNNKFWFAGQEQDDESGLSNFGARYYSPLIGRFLSVDPIKAPPDRLFSPYRLNLYAYARNNPTGFVDLDGREDRPGDQAIVDNLLQLHEMCNRIQSESGSSDFAIAQTKASAMGLWNQFKAIYHRSTPPSIEFQRYVASKTDELLAPGERNGEIVMALLRSIGEFIDEVGAALDLAELSKTKTDEPDWAQPNFIFANTYMAFFMRQWNAEHHDQYGWVEPHKPPMPAFSNAALGVPMVARGLESIMYGVAALVGLPSSVPAVNVWDRNHSAQGGSFGGGCGGACGGGSYAKEVDKTKGN